MSSCAGVAYTVSMTSPRVLIRDTSFSGRSREERGTADLSSDPSVCSVCRASITRAHRWRILRLALGMLEMLGAVVTGCFPVILGLTPVTVASLLITTTLTAVSVLLFGGRRAAR